MEGVFITSNRWKHLITLLVSDLHMYEGRTAAQSGIVFGHEKYELRYFVKSKSLLSVLHSMGIVDVLSNSSFNTVSDILILRILFI